MKIHCKMYYNLNKSDIEVLFRISCSNILKFIGNMSIYFGLRHVDRRTSIACVKQLFYVI